MSVTAIGNKGGGQRILVCDDERHIVRLLQVNLERQGHIVVCAFDGKEALKILSEADGVSQPRFDRVLLDVILPITDGFEVLKWIRSHNHTKDLWVALMVSRLQDGDLTDQVPYRPNKYLAKPFNPQDVLA